MKFKILLLVVALVIYDLNIAAETPVAPAEQTIPSAGTATSTTPKLYLPNVEFKEDFCPQPNALVKNDDLTWSAPGDWKSDSESFSTEIDHFIGARWQGINVGKVICLYKGKGRETFPIALVRETLVPMPSGNSWGPYTQGAKDCFASDPAECVFYIEKKKKIDNVYEMLNFYKNVKSEDDE